MYEAMVCGFRQSGFSDNYFKRYRHRVFEVVEKEVPVLCTRVQLQRTACLHMVPSGVHGSIQA